MNKRVLVLGIVGILLYSVPPMPAKAISYTYTQAVSTENQIRTAGLISSYYLNISKGDNCIYINGKTQGTDSMKSIGFKNISIEYSSDEVNWKEEKSLDNLLKSNSSSYYLNNYSVSVKGGYYYRVTLTHYAKESGLFGSSQSVENHSNSVWID